MDTTTPGSRLLPTNANDGNDHVVMSSPSDDGDQQPLREEIPFLVTHWLSNFGRTHGAGSEEAQAQKEAIATIRRAASEIASAFSTLGAYGTTLRVSQLKYCIALQCLLCISVPRIDSHWILPIPIVPLTYLACTLCAS